MMRIPFLTLSPCFLLLIACGHTQSTLPQPIGYAASYTTRVKPLAGEVFKATNVVIHHSGGCPDPLGGISVRFTATGTAAGPYPGTFSIHGSWSYESVVLQHWSFDEKATIKSHGNTIGAEVTGVGSRGEPRVSCGAFGPSDQDDGLNYTGASTGVATVHTRAGFLNEKFL